MKDLRTSISVLVALLLTLAVGGCAAVVGRFDEFPQHRQMAPMPDGPLCRVAVLPFLNDSDYPLAEVLVAKVFAAQFTAMGNALVVQEGDVLKLYQQLRLMPGQEPTPEQLQIIASRLEAQLLITGTVVEMRENPGQQESVNPLVAIDVQLRDGQHGEPVWGVYHRRLGADYRAVMHFGTIQTVTGLSRQMAEEIITLWFDKGLPRCDVSPRS